MTDIRNQDIGIVFVHGIVGNSHFFDFLMDAVPKGCKIISLTLEGHDGDALAFSKASMRSWKRQVEEATDSLAKECKRIVIVAHSMGTLFALDQGARNRADALFLLNPPMRIRLTRRLFLNPIKVMLGITTDPITMAARDAYGISLDYNPLHYYGWPRRYFELFSEIKRVRKVIDNVRIKTRVFIAGRDEMVSPSSVDYFKPLKNCRLWQLPDSGHYYYTPSDRELILRQFSSLMADGIAEKG
ncbi:MAG: alpha/beta fold hydrolase [Muribaculaceae bacterium]|nr:alpha/beta fold hydrolase [Muribaculaceae bacterium]